MTRFILVPLFVFVPVFAFAQGIVINEIAWMGTPVEGVESKQWWRYEWIELYNTSEEQVNLEGWTIELSRPSSAEASAGKDNLDWTISLNGRVGPKEYFLVASSDKIPNFNVNYSNLGGKFANSGQVVVLRDACGDVQEEIDARQEWFAGDNEDKYTMERWKPLEAGNSPDNWATSLSSGGTPKTQNSIFGKESIDIQKMIPQSGFATAGQLSSRSSVTNILLSSVFLLALAMSLVSVVGILFLKKYLEGSLLE